MQLSTKARYATRAVIELALNYGRGPIMLKEIAKQQNISNKYLEQLMAPLRADGIVYTLRGNRGGYVLARVPEDITLYDIIRLVEGSLAPVECVDRAEICSRTDICVTRNVWCKVKEQVVEILKCTTVADLAKEQFERTKKAEEENLKMKEMNEGA